MSCCVYMLYHIAGIKFEKEVCKKHWVVTTHLLSLLNQKKELVFNRFLCAAVNHQRLHGQITGWDGERDVQQGGVASPHHLQQQRQPLGERRQQQSERWADEFKT